MPLHFDITLALGMLVVGIGALLQSSTGFGFALFSAPLLALIDPHLVPGPVLLLTLVLTFGVLARDWRDIDWPGLGWISAGRLPATLVAGVMAGMVAKPQLSVVFALFVLCGVAVSLTGRRFDPNPAALVTAGGLAGFFGTLTSIGAPPLVLVYQHGHASVIRSTLSANVVIGTVASIAALTVGGQLGSEDLTRSLVFAPACVVGLVLSNRARRWLDGYSLRPILLAISAAAAIGVLIREWMR